MNLRHIALTLAAVSLMATVTKAQDKEVGIYLGTTLYQGDLSKKQITLNETKPGFGLLFRYYWGPRIDVKVGLNYGMIEGDDANYTDDPDRIERNLSFKSHVIELSGQAELNILPYISNSKKYRFAPYIFGGVSAYHFNPKAELNGKWYALQPLGTEGQLLPGGKGKYSLFQVAIPYGIGLKYSLGNFWNIALELGQRKMFTDYLDDVSGAYPDYEAMVASGNEIGGQLANRSPEVTGEPYTYRGPSFKRGDPDDLDMFDFVGFTITKTLRRFSCTGF